MRTPLSSQNLSATLSSNPSSHHPLNPGPWLSLPSKRAAVEENEWEENKWILPRFSVYRALTSEAGRKETQPRGWNEPWVCSPPQALSGLMSGKKRKDGFRPLGEGLAAGSQWWLRSIVVEETEQICSCQTCFRNSLKATQMADIMNRRGTGDHVKH